MNNVVDFKPKDKETTPTPPNFTIKPLRNFANAISVLVLTFTGFALMGTSFMGIVAIAWACYIIIKSERSKYE
jgi:hypothetical protein